MVPTILRIVFAAPVAFLVGSEASQYPSLGRFALPLDPGVTARSDSDDAECQQAFGGQSRATRQPRRFPWKLPAEAEADWLKRCPLAWVWSGSAA